MNTYSKIIDAFLAKPRQARSCFLPAVDPTRPGGREGIFGARVLAATHCYHW